MSNNNLTDERLSALIRVARDSLELYEMELPVIDDVMLALAELQQRRAAMLQGTEKTKLPTTIQTAPALDVSSKNAESVTTIKPVADLYSIAIPGGRSTTYSTDTAEASDCRAMGWAVQEYVKLDRYQAAMLQNKPQNTEPRCSIQTAPVLDSLPKNDESRCNINQGKAEPVSQPYTLPSREHFESLCCQFWNWRELDSINEGEEEPRLWWDGNDYTHRVTKALWRMYQAASQPHNEQQNIAENLPTLREAVTAIRNSGIAIDSEKIQMERLGAEFEEVLSNMTYDEMKPVTPEKCWCRTCRPVTVTDMRFVVCPECGNKRCPRANDCRNACSGSNDPGQAGSAYPAPQQEEKVR